MRKRNVSAVYESSYDNDISPSSYGYQTQYGGSGNPIINPAGSITGGGGETGFPQLPTLPNVPQQPTPNLELYNKRCPDGFKLVRGQCKSIASGSEANGSETNGVNDGANGSEANGSGNDSGNGSEASGSGLGNGTGGTRKRTSKVKKYLLPIAIIGVLAIGYFSIKKVLKNG